jgi:hypothetical protein
LGFPLTAKGSERGMVGMRRVASGVVLAVAPEFAASPARTLILGLDEAGRIVDHDRPAADLLDGAGGSLLGTEFASLVTDRLQAELFGQYPDAVCAGRDVTTVVKVRAPRVGQTDAVVTLQPVSSSTGLAARVIVRIMPPAEGRFADMEVMRRALLDAPISQVGGGLGIDEVAPKVTRIAVPHFCNVGGLVVRETLIAEDELSVIPPDGSLLGTGHFRTGDQRGPLHPRQHRAAPGSWRTVCSARCGITLPRCRGCARRGRKRGPGWGCWWSARSPAAGAPAARRRARLCGANCRCPRTTRAPHPWNRDVRRDGLGDGARNEHIHARWPQGDVVRLAGYQRQRGSGTADGCAHAVARGRGRQAFR